MSLQNGNINGWLYLDIFNTFNEAENKSIKHRICWIEKYPSLEYKIQTSSIGYKLYVNLHEK